MTTTEKPGIIRAHFRARKRADLLSICGAAVAALAAGAWLAPTIVRFGPVLFGIGLAAHAVGMAGRHRLDRQGGALPGIWQWLYVACWAAMAVAAVILVVARWTN